MSTGSRGWRKAAIPIQQEPHGDKAGIILPSGGRGIRFTDSKGRNWHVFERERVSHDRRSIHILIFESDTAVRCVREYPNDWQRLEAEALEYLSWRK